ncbi:c-type cytochrome [bacterium]|nr:c-type cytochrome [bacterium]MDB4378087.1 c-type cytochrome [Akkermansiaceae bacterium]
MLLAVTSALLLPAPANVEESSLAKIGRQIFLDSGLSQPMGQSCYTCHNPQKAFADPRPVSSGAVSERVGTRNAPSLMYAALIPPMAIEDVYDEEGEASYIIEGGLFLDGRAHDLLEQVKQPFFEKNEMNLSGEKELAARLRSAGYAPRLRKALKEGEWDDDEKVAQLAYRSLVAFLREPLFRPFNARIDDYWAGKKDAITAAEERGLGIFINKGECAKCHFVGTGVWPKTVFTDYGYDNLGVPSRGEKDPGLGLLSKREDELGQFRVPSLRNVALTAPYFHNGSVATLKEVMEFYNSRDLEPERWGKTDYPETVNHEDMGDLKMTKEEIDDLVAFMFTLTDQSLLKMKPSDTLPETPAGVPTAESAKVFFESRTDRIDPAAPR